MDETRKAENKGVKSTQDVLKKWNDYYIDNNFGIGIQCDKCKKWREVFQYEDRSEVPDVWICSMWKINEHRRGSCRIPSDLREEDFADGQYAPGSLVWAKMEGYPWWPAMVEDCPDIQHYYMPYEDTESEYHVNFFGSKPLRHWLKESHIKDFSTPPPTSPRAKKNKDLKRSIEQANEALNMPVKERLKNYSFVVRYKGHWATVKELDKVDLPPNSLKRRQREKSTESRSQALAEEPRGSRDTSQISTVRRVKSVKYKSEAVIKSKSEDNEEHPPTLSQKKKMEKNKSSRNQFIDLVKPESKEKQQSFGGKHKIKRISVHEDRNKNYTTSECSQPSLTEGNDQSEVKQTTNFGELIDVKSGFNKEVQGEGHHSTKDKENEEIMETSDVEVSPVQNSTQREGHRLYNENKETEENMETSTKEDLLSKQNDTKMSSDSEDEAMATKLKIFSEFLNKMYPPICLTEPIKSLPNTDAENVVDSSDDNSENDTVIYQENESENDFAMNNESAAAFSEIDPVVNQGTAAEYSQNDSDSCILDTDASFLRTSYPSCSTSENEQFPHRSGKFRKNQELTDELISSNNSKYIPYSFYRKRMKK